ncbi:MAG: phosphatase PAP2 family protein [Ilumatobacteraceae bacterium]
MWLPYRYGFMIAAACALVVVAARQFRQPVARTAAAIIQELGIVMTLYGIWQYVRSLAVTKSEGAVANARTLWDIQRWMHLPNEATLQSWVIDNRPIMWFLNAYYGVAHVPAAVALLIWVFWKHRDRYPTIRATFALTIAGCIAIQAWIPMAPPRFLPDLGFIDAGLKYHMSVYGTGSHGISNEVAAMPSLHWAWAILVAVTVWKFETTRWRWIGVVHLFLTMCAVTLTANHWWLDGIVAGLIVGLAYVAQRAARTGWRGLVDPPPEALVSGDADVPVEEWV